LAETAEPLSEQQPRLDVRAAVAAGADPAKPGEFASRPIGRPPPAMHRRPYRPTKSVAPLILAAGRRSAIAPRLSRAGSRRPQAKGARFDNASPIRVYAQAPRQRDDTRPSNSPRRPRNAAAALARHRAHLKTPICALWVFLTKTRKQNSLAIDKA